MNKIDKIKRRQKGWAAEFVDSWAKTELKDFSEPVRAGVKKGDPIGFTKEKKLCALMMTLYPHTLNLQEIADKCDTTSSVVRVWRGQKKFQKEIERAYDSLGRLIANTVENLLTGSTLEPSIHEIKGLRFEDNFSEAIWIVDLLPFFNDAVAVPLMEVAFKKMDQSPAFNQIVMRHFEAPDFYRSKSLRHWELRPSNLGFLYVTTETVIDRLVDPKARKKLGENGIRELANVLKKALSCTFENLGGEGYIAWLEKMKLRIQESSMS